MRLTKAVLRTIIISAGIAVEIMWLHKSLLVALWLRNNCTQSNHIDFKHAMGEN